VGALNRWRGCLAIALLVPVAISSITVCRDISDAIVDFLTKSIEVLTEFFTCTAIINAVDYRNPATRTFFLRQILPTHSGSGIAQMCDIWDYCNGNFVYVLDPSGEAYTAYASETISNGLKGDCEDFAILMAAGVLAIGGYARIVLEKVEEGGHAYAEVCVPKEHWRSVLFYLRERYPGVYSFRYHIDDSGEAVWLNLDYQLFAREFDQHPGGPFLLGGDGVFQTCYP